MKNRRASLFLALLLALPAAARAEKISLPLAAKDLASGQAASLKSGKKGLVLVFLSAHCPCSNSHVVALKGLAETYPDFSFAAVHANSDEGRAVSQAYFSAAALPFPVVQDTGAKLADRFGASKTPHAFLLSPAGEILYKGGVSDSSDYAHAKERFLADALAAVNAGKPAPKASARTLGCAIARGEKDDW